MLHHITPSIQAQIRKIEIKNKKRKQKETKFIFLKSKRNIIKELN